MATSFSQRVRLSQGGALMYEKETWKERATKNKGEMNVYLRLTEEFSSCMKFKLESEIFF